MKVVCLHKDEFLYKGLTFPYRGITFLFLSNLSFSGAHYRIAMHRSTKQYELYLDAASLQSSTQNITIMEISSKGAAHMLLPPKKNTGSKSNKTTMQMAEYIKVYPHSYITDVHRRRENAFTFV
jgi:hypothetical protein